MATLFTVAWIFLAIINSFVSAFTLAEAEETAEIVHQLDNGNVGKVFHTIDSGDFGGMMKKIGDSLPVKVTSGLGKLRGRRSVESQKVSFTTAHLNDSHTQLVVHWAGKGSDVIMALAKDNSDTTTSSVFVSSDYGVSWDEKNLTCYRNRTRVPAVIQKYYENPVAPGYYVFTDVKNDYLFHSRNYAANIHSHGLVFTPTKIYFHPTNKNYLLALDETRHQVYMSTNFGTRWSRIQSNVNGIHWGTKDIDPDYVYLERGSYTSGITVVKMNVIIHGSSFLWYHHSYNSIQSIKYNVHDFTLIDRYMFATTMNTYGPAGSTPNIYTLSVSKDRGSFIDVTFPNFTKAQDFFVADASEDQVFLCVMRDNVTDLYISDSSGLHYSLSLRNIVYYNPKIHTSSPLKRHKLKKPFADLTKIEGLDGVYIVSQYLDDSYDPTRQKTYITYNKGGQWRLIKAPTKDRYGAKTHCDLRTGCSLHLSQYYNYLHPSARHTPVLTSENAPGLIVATGGLGAWLKHGGGIYMSSDGGLKWTHVRSGDHFYGMADHGGLVVVVRRFLPITVFGYTWDEGRTWHFHNFTTKPMIVYGLLTEPGEKTTVFSVFGSFPEKHSWQVIQLNLTNVFSRTCSQNDYMKWAMYLGDGSCLLGKKVVYERRVPNVPCLNGITYERGLVEKNCSCTRQDYECDTGYLLNATTGGTTGPCYASSNVTFDPPKRCPVGTYPKTQGYRKVPDDQCVGGAISRYEPYTYNCPTPEEREFMVYVDSRSRIIRIDLANNRKDIIYYAHKKIFDLTFDYPDNCVYWSTGDIQRLCLNGGGHKVEQIIHTSGWKSVALAFDWVGQNLYWLDLQYGTMIGRAMVAKKDGRYKRVLYTVGLGMGVPGTNLLLDPIHGYMYWGYGRNIYKGPMDGDNNTTPIKLIYQETTYPIGRVTIDLSSDRLYWVAGSSFIKNSNLNGTNVKLVTKTIATDIAIYKRDMYWTTSNAIYFADNTNGFGRRRYINDTYTSLLKIYHRASQHGTNPCQNNTQCPQLCLAKPGNSSHPQNVSYSCKCGDGYVGSYRKCQCENGETLENGRCINNATTKACAGDQFRCNNGECIQKSEKCDKFPDCSDKSDELKCSPTVRCGNTEFACTSGECIDLTWVCDHDKDCSDGSDEKNSKCKFSCNSSETFQCSDGRCLPASWKCDMDDDCEDDEKDCQLNVTVTCDAVTEFKCHNSSDCVPNSWVCDGMADCSDKSDETGTVCTNHTCPWNKFPCGNGYCIFKSWVCDGEFDCKNHKDEQNCPTTTPYKTSIPPYTGCGFRCHSDRHCLPLNQVCDRVRDCHDGSDEIGCATPPPPTSYTTWTPWTTPRSTPCAADRFYCGPNDRTPCIRRNWMCDDYTTRRPWTTPRSTPCAADRFYCGPNDRTPCIRRSWVCDGTKDCDDGEDEKNCGNKTQCSRDEFRCDSADMCVKVKVMCDGVKHCADGSDEWGCHTTGSYITTRRPPPPVKSCRSPSMVLCNRQCVTPDVVCRQLSCNMARNKLCGDRVTFYRVKITPTNVTLWWSIASGLLGTESKSYIPAYSLGGKFWNQSDTSHPAFVFKNLQPSTRYDFYIYVKYNNIAHFPTKYSVTTKDSGVLATPTDVQAELIEGRDKTLSINVTWKVGQGYAGRSYNIYLAHSGQKWNQQVTMHSAPKNRQYSYVVITPWLHAPSHMHLFTVQVSAVNKLGLESKRSTPIDVHWGGLSDPYATVIHVNTDGTINLAWKVVNPKLVTGYNVTYLDGWNVPQFLISTTPSASNLAYSNCHQLDTYKVHAYNKTAKSANVPFPFSGYGCKTTVAPPTSVFVSALSKTTVRVSWNHVQTLESGSKYVVFYTPNRKIGDKDLPAIPLVSKRNYTVHKSMKIRNLQACDEYRFWVAVNGTRTSLPSAPYTVTTQSDTKAQPKKLKATAMPKLKCVNITWEAACRTELIPVEYIVHITETRPPYYVGNWISRSKSTIPRAGSNLKYNYTICKMSAGAKYEVKVKTKVNGSRWSDAVNVSFDAVDGPTSFKSKAIRGALMFFMWEKPATMATGWNYYLLYRECAENGVICNGNFQPLDSTNRTYIVIDKIVLMMNNTYEFCVATGPPKQGYMSKLSEGMRIEGPTVDDSLIRAFDNSCCLLHGNDGVVSCHRCQEQRSPSRLAHVPSRCWSTPLVVGSPPCAC